MKRLAFIPARGGSKRLKRKNIRKLKGKPLICYSIEAALETHLFDSVVVSTEDQEIASIAAAYPISLDVRPEVLSEDRVTVLQVLKEYLSRTQLWQAGDTVCVLYATAPFRDAEDIGAVVNKLETADYNSVMAVTEYPLPVHQAMQESEAGLAPVFKELFFKNSQEIGTYLVDNGSTYAVRLQAELAQQELLMAPIGGHRMPFMRSIDVDTEEDFKMLEALIGRSASGRHHAA